MTISAPAFVTVSPSFIEPNLIMPYTQASGFTEVLFGGDPQIRLKMDDQYVFVKKLNIRQQVSAAQQPANVLPGCDIVLSQASTPTYLMRSRAQYDHHDVNAAGNWGVSVPEAYRLGNRQGMNQQARNAALYGFNPQNGEGILSGGGTAVNLPPDSFGDTTASTYDPGQMATFLLQQIQLLKGRMNQLGLPLRVTILGPQRILGIFTYPGIVQLTSVQRPGGGNFTTMQLIAWILEENKDELFWAYDDTLIGKGSGGSDAVLIVAPEIKKPNAPKFNTNVFADLTPALDATVTMYADMAVPMEITSPLADGATNTLYEQRITSGWVLRPEAVTVVSMVYQ